MNPDIVLVNSNAGSTKSMPIGILSLAAVLEAAGWQVECRDYQLLQHERKLDPEVFFRFLPASAPVVGISVMCNSLPTVLGAVERLKAARPWQKVILGGPAATDAPDAILRRFPVDVLVRGEGEETLRELMPLLATGAAAGELERVQGISFRDGGLVMHTAARPRIEHLDILPTPAYHHVNLQDYDGVVPVVSTRGCPYDCAFCSAHSVWERKLTYRSAERIAADVAALKGQARRIDFHDDTFTLSRARVRALIEALRGHGVTLPWTCNARINLMSEPFLAEMAELGCQEVLYGIESGSDQVLNRIAKHITAAEARRTVADTARYLKGVVTSYIWGYPFETVEDFYETLLCIAGDFRIAGVRPQFGLLAPLPQSPMRRWPEARLRFDPDFVSPAVFPTTERLREYPELVFLILTHPDLFSAFYYYDHAELQAKRELVQRMVTP